MIYIDKINNFYKTHRQLIISFAYGFFIIFITSFLFAQRQNTARKLTYQYNQFKIEMAKIGYIINEKNTDLNFFTTKISLDINNLNIKSEKNSLMIEKIRIYAPSLKNKKISIKSIGEIKINKEKTKLNDIQINVSFFDNNKLNQISGSIKGTKNAELNFEIKRTSQFVSNNKSDYINFQIAIKNAKLNDFKFDIIKTSGNIKGNFVNNSDEPDLNLWLENNGSIIVKNLFIENSDFSIIAKGRVNINHNKEMSFNFDTASYGLIELINKLENKNLLRREKSTIAKIILNNKKSDDKNLITTPIILDKNKLYIDRVELINFND